MLEKPLAHVIIAAGWVSEALNTNPHPKNQPSTA